MDFFFKGFGFDRGKAVVGLTSEALEYTNTRPCSKKFFAAILLLVGFGSRIALGRCIVERVRAGARGYPDSREVPGTTCFSQPILMTPLNRDHLMIEGFGAFLIDANVIQSGGSQGEELQQRWSLWTEARASCDIHESRHRKFLPLDFLEYWNVYPKVDVWHTIMVLECKDNSQNEKARQDPGWDAEISMRCCHL